MTDELNNLAETIVAESGEAPEIKELLIAWSAKFFQRDIDEIRDAVATVEAAKAETREQKRCEKK